MTYDARGLDIHDGETVYHDCYRTQAAAERRAEHLADLPCPINTAPHTVVIWRFVVQGRTYYQTIYGGIAGGPLDAGQALWRPAGATIVHRIPFRALCAWQRDQIAVFGPPRLRTV